MEDVDQRLLGAMVYNLLNPKTHTTIVCKDEETKQNVRKEYSQIVDNHKCENQIESADESKMTFANGSTITIIVPDVPSDTIRGKRSEVISWQDIEDYDYDVVKEYLNSTIEV